MKAEYVNVINMLYDQSKKAYVDCDRGNLFWGDDGNDEFFTLEILSNDLATLEKISIFSHPEVVEWIELNGQQKESYKLMIYLLSLESLRTALIIFLNR